MINRKVRSIVLWLINNDEIEQNDDETKQNGDKIEEKEEEARI